MSGVVVLAILWTVGSNVEDILPANLQSFWLIELYKTVRWPPPTPYRLSPLDFSLISLE